MNHKPVDINQRIPLETLHVGLETFLNGAYSEAYILEQLRLEFSGENRLKKSVRIVNKILLRSPISDLMQEKSELIKLAIKNKDDKNLILIALLNSAFVFSFNTLDILSKFLSVQEFVNRDTLKKSLSAIYGGNRATENAIDSVIPMFIEAGLIARPKPGLYKKNESLKINTPIAKELYNQSYYIHNPMAAKQQSGRHPYLKFID